jgi:hypothetical protein
MPLRNRAPAPNPPAASAEAQIIRKPNRIAASIKKAVARTANPAGRIEIAIPSGVSAVRMVSIAEFKPV